MPLAYVVTDCTWSVLEPESKVAVPDDIEVHAPAQSCFSKTFFSSTKKAACRR